MSASDIHQSRYRSAASAGNKYATQKLKKSDKPGIKRPYYKYGIHIDRPKTSSMAERALQIETKRAIRHVKEYVTDEQDRPVPRIPSVLAYLRWLDKMDGWYKKPGTLHETSARLRDTEDLYSWNSGFGAPVVLPKIRKHPNPEKYHSKQLQNTILDPKLRDSDGRLPQPDYVGAIREKQFERRFQAAQGHATSHAMGGITSGFPKHNSGNRNKKNKETKYTKFYIHAMNGFKYWPEEKYIPPVHHTKYSFGNQFNSGRAGVVTDRIYTRPRSNKHYWTEFQLHQNPIGSGNTVAGKVLSN